MAKSLVEIRLILLEHVIPETLERDFFCCLHWCFMTELPRPDLCVVIETGQNNTIAVTLGISTLSTDNSTNANDLPTKLLCPTKQIVVGRFSFSHHYQGRIHFTIDEFPDTVGKGSEYIPGIPVDEDGLQISVRPGFQGV